MAVDNTTTRSSGILRSGRFGQRAVTMRFGRSKEVMHLVWVVLYCYWGIMSVIQSTDAPFQLLITSNLLHPPSP
eukprot:scaffold1361_cov269-Alexandrium_tamarense.AAC.3